MVEYSSMYTKICEFQESLNQGLEYKSKVRLNLILTSSMLFAPSDYLLRELLQNSAQIPFTISTFRLTEIELSLYEKYTHDALSQTAKARLSNLHRLEQYRVMSYYKSPIDIVRLEEFKAPICFVTCNINEAVEISRLALPQNDTHILLDRFEKDSSNQNMDTFTAKFDKGIKSVSDIYDAAQLRLWTNEVEDAPNAVPDVFEINGSNYVATKDFSPLRDSGGEGDLFRITFDGGKVIKIIRYPSETKMMKIKYFLSDDAKKLPMAAFCPLPQALVYTLNGAEIGYTMEYIHGTRLDRYVARMADDSRTKLVDVLMLFLRITLAVRAVHLSDCVIGDLCVYNFMVEKSGYVKIVDCDSFQIMDYPNDGVHYEAMSYIDGHEGLYLSCEVDYHLLRSMLDELILYFNTKIQERYNAILNSYNEKVNDICGLIFAFYYHLLSLGEI